MSGARSCRQPAKRGATICLCCTGRWGALSRRKFPGEPVDRKMLNRPFFFKTSGTIPIVNNNTYIPFFTNYCTAVRGGLDED